MKEGDSPSSEKVTAEKTNESVNCKSKPNPFRDEIARQIHNVVERRRKDKINQWIKKISELLPYKNTRKESKIGILERAYHYFNQLKDTNDNLMLHNFEKVQADELKFSRKRIKELEQSNESYYKLLRIAGISPCSFPSNLWSKKPTKYSNKLISQQLKNLDNISNKNCVNNQEDSESSDENEGCSNAKKVKTTYKKTEKSKLVKTVIEEDNLLTINRASSFSNNSTPVIFLNNQQINSNVSRINLASSAQTRPSYHLQMLNNGTFALEPVPSSSINQSPIILGSSVVNPPPQQQTTILMPNGQLVSVVNPSQLSVIYNPGSGFVLSNPQIAHQLTTFSTHNVQISPVSIRKKSPKKKIKTTTTFERVTLSPNSPLLIGNKSKSNSIINEKLNSVQVALNKENEVENININNRDKNLNNDDLNNSSVKINSTVSSDTLTTSTKSLFSHPSEKHVSSSENIAKKSRVNKTSNTFSSNDSHIKVIEKKIEKCKKNKSNDTEETESDKNGSKNIKDKNLNCEEITSSNQPGSRINFTFTQNNNKNSQEQSNQDHDQELPLLLSSLSDENDISSESVQSVSNSSLPTFLSLSPSDHLSDFLSKELDSNTTVRSVRCSTPSDRGSESSNQITQTSNNSNNYVNISSSIVDQTNSISNDNQEKQNTTNESGKILTNGTSNSKTSNVSICLERNYSISSNNHQNEEIIPSSMVIQHSSIGQIESSNQESNHSTKQAPSRSSNGHNNLSENLLHTSHQTNNIFNSIESQEGIKSTSSHSTTDQISKQQKSSKSYDIRPYHSNNSNLSDQRSNSSHSSLPVPSSTSNSSSSTLIQTHTSHNQTYLPYSAEALIRQPSSVSISSSYNVDSSIDHINFSSLNNVGNRNSITSRPLISYSAERLIHSSTIETDHNQKSSESEKQTESNQSHDLYSDHYPLLFGRSNENIESSLWRSNSDQQHHQPFSRIFSQNQENDQPNHDRSNLNQRALLMNQPQQHSLNSYLQQPSSNGQHLQNVSHQQFHLSSRHQQSSQNGQNQSQNNNQQQISQQQNRVQTNSVSLSTNSESRNNFEHFSHSENTSDRHSRTTNSNFSNSITAHNQPNRRLSSSESSSYIDIPSISSSSQNNFLVPFTPPNSYQSSLTNNTKRTSSSTSLNPFSYSDPLNTNLSFSNSSIASEPSHYSRNSRFVSSTIATEHSTNCEPSNSLTSNSNLTNCDISSSSTNHFFENHSSLSLQSSNHSNPSNIFSTGSTFTSLISNTNNSSNFENNNYLFSPRTLPFHHTSHTTTPTSQSAFSSTTTIFSQPLFSESPNSIQNHSSNSSKTKSTDHSSNNKNSNNNKQNKANPSSTKSNASKKCTHNNNNSGKQNNRQHNQTTNETRNSNPSSYFLLTDFGSSINNFNLAAHSSTSSNLTQSSLTLPSLNNDLNTSGTRNDSSYSLFRAQSQNNNSLNLNLQVNNMSPTFSTSSSISSSTSYPSNTTRTSSSSVNISSTNLSYSLVSNFNLSNIFPDIGSSNLNENLSVPSLSALKFPSTNHVHLGSQNGGNALISSTSSIQPTSMETINSCPSLSTLSQSSSSHQSFYPHSTRITTSHHNPMSLNTFLGNSKHSTSISASTQSSVSSASPITINSSDFDPKDKSNPNQLTLSRMSNTTMSSHPFHSSAHSSHYTHRHHGSPFF